MHRRRPDGAKQQRMDWTEHTEGQQSSATNKQWPHERYLKDIFTFSIAGCPLAFAFGDVAVLSGFSRNKNDWKVVTGQLFTSCEAV